MSDAFERVRAALRAKPTPIGFGMTSSVIAITLGATGTPENEAIAIARAVMEDYHDKPISEELTREVIRRIQELQRRTHE